MTYYVSDFNPCLETRLLGGGAGVFSPSLKVSKKRIHVFRMGKNKLNGKEIKLSQLVVLKKSGIFSRFFLPRVGMQSILVSLSHGNLEKMV